MTRTVALGDSFSLAIHNESGIDSKIQNQTSTPVLFGSLASSLGLG